MLRGQLTVEDAVPIISGQPSCDTDVVRFTSAGALRSRGFHVEHTPNRWNPSHVSVSLPTGAVTWDTEAEDVLQGAFDEWGEVANDEDEYRDSDGS